jgi:hypothetical protein
LETETDSKTLELAPAFQQKLVRIRHRDFGKSDAIAGAKLRCNAEIDRDHVRYFRITTDGLAIAQEQNRLTAWWNLDCTWGDSFRDKIGFDLAFQFRAIEPNTHAI